MTGVVGTMALLPEPFPQCVLRLFGFVRSEGRAIRRDEDNEISSSSSLAALRRRYNQQSERELCWLCATRVYLKVDPLIIHRREGNPFKMRGAIGSKSSKTIITLNGAKEWG